MSDSTPVSEGKTAVWQTTRVPNLLRHGSSGRYYARIQVSGKRKLVALRTGFISVARRKLIKVLEHAEIDRMRGDSGDVGTVTMGTLSDLYQKRFQSDSGLTARRLPGRTLCCAWRSSGLGGRISSPARSPWIRSVTSPITYITKSRTPSQMPGSAAKATRPAPLA
jgi:hypothetical protein